MTSALNLALLSLQGLALGDCFGEQFFLDHDVLLPRLQQRIVPPGPWLYTDDTEMALSVVEVLARHGRIVQDELAQRFARRMEPQRGYGIGTYQVLNGIREGRSWRTLTAGGFQGMGSFGNGGAMRVAPLGAFFATADRATLIEQARLSAEPTHFHPEGVAGTIAVAVATAEAWLRREQPLSTDWLEQVAASTPPGYPRDGIVTAARLPAETDIVPRHRHWATAPGLRRRTPCRSVSGSQPTPTTLSRRSGKRSMPSAIAIRPAPLSVASSHRASAQVLSRRTGSPAVSPTH